MSTRSFKNAHKSNQRPHRERGQLSSRSHLGLLEKKKDYKLRARDYQEKQRTLKALKRKALNKNPDEFYFKMVKTHMKDGIHQCEDTKRQYTDEQLKLMKSQDINYVHYKRSVEQKKIDRLKGSLHLLDTAEKPKNNHLIFLDSKKEVKEFDAVKYFDTHPVLLNRAYNRPRTETLKSGHIQGIVDDEMLAELAVERKKKYQELEKRIDREKNLNVISQKLQIKKHLMDKTSEKKKIVDETPQTAASYKWTYKRKR